MNTAKLLHPEYIVDATGEKKSVILSVDDYNNLMEEIVDLADIAERRNEPTKKHDDLVAELKANGYL